MNTKKLEEEKLAVFNYFWNNATDNIFILILDEKNKEFTVKDINPSQLKALGLKKKT